MDVARYYQKIRSKEKYFDRLQILKQVCRDELSSSHSNRVELLSEFIEEFPFEVDLWMMLIESRLFLNPNTPAEETLEILKWGASLNPRSLKFIQFATEKAESLFVDSAVLYSFMSEVIPGIGFCTLKQPIWIRFLTLLVENSDLEPNINKVDGFFYQYARLNILSLDKSEHELSLYQRFLRLCSLSQLKTMAQLHFGEGGSNLPIDDLREKLFDNFQVSMFNFEASPLKQELRQIDEIVYSRSETEELRWLREIREAKVIAGKSLVSESNVIRFVYETALSNAPHSSPLWQSYYDHLRSPEQSDYAYLAIFFGKYRKMLSMAFPKLFIYLVEFEYLQLEASYPEFLCLTDGILQDLFEVDYDSTHLQLANSNLIFERIFLACAHAKITQNHNLLTGIRQLMCKNFFLGLDETKISELLPLLFDDEIFSSTKFRDELWSSLNAMKYKTLSALSLVKVFEILNRHFHLTRYNGNEQILLMRETLGLMRFNCKLDADVRPMVSSEHMSEECLVVFNKWCVDVLFEPNLKLNV